MFYFRITCNTVSDVKQQPSFSLIANDESNAAVCDVLQMFISISRNNVTEIKNYNILFFLSLIFRDKHVLCPYKFQRKSV